MRDLVIRPVAPAKKISHTEEFEFCYLRHSYLRKVNWNPSEQDMMPYYGIIKSLAKKTYLVYGGTFRLVGADLDDLINIGKVQLVSYLGLFSVEATQENHDEFVEEFRARHRDFPTADDFLDKNKADFTSFLKQRYQDVFRVFLNKGANIAGYDLGEYHVYYGTQPPPSDITLLEGKNKKYGFKKKDIQAFRALKKKMKGQDGPVYQFEGVYYVTVPIRRRTLSWQDIVGSYMNPYENAQHASPEDILLAKNNELEFEAKKEEFLAKSENYRIKAFKKFIALHKDNPRYTDEVREARRQLKRKNP